MPSVTPQAKAALLSLISARSGLSGVLVQRGLPTEMPPEYDRVYIGDSTGSYVWAQLGQYKREEDLNVTVVIEVYRDGDEQTATEDRAFAVMSEVEGAIAGSVTLSNTVRWARPASYREEINPTDEGWLARIWMTVAAEARIT